MVRDLEAAEVRAHLAPLVTVLHAEEEVLVQRRAEEAVRQRVGVQQRERQRAEVRYVVGLEQHAEVRRVVLVGVVVVAPLKD